MPHADRTGKHSRPGRPARHAGSRTLRTGRRLTALAAIVTLALAAGNHFGSTPNTLATHTLTVQHPLAVQPTPAPGDNPDLPPRPILGPDFQTV